jgi:pilus assembly protein CpaE
VELRRAVLELTRSAPEAAPRGTVVTLFPTRGGVGATSIATNLAGALQRQGERVVVVDFALHLGDVLSVLDLAGSYCISDVLANLGRLDRDLLETSLVRHASGVQVLAQCGKVEEADNVRASDVGRLLGFLRQHYDRVIVDGVRGFDELSLAVLDATQKLVLVANQDVPAVRNAKRCLDLVRRLGLPEERIALLLNRFSRDSKITPEVIADTVGIPVTHTLANDFAAAIDSINRGQMLTDAAPRSRLTRDLEELGPALFGAARSGGRRPSGFFRTFLSKRGDNGTAGPA